MTNKTILMTKIRQILRSFTQGKSKVQISEQAAQRIELKGESLRRKWNKKTEDK